MSPLIRFTPPRRARGQIAGFVNLGFLSRKIYRRRLAPFFQSSLPPLPRPDILCFLVIFRPHIMRKKIIICVVFSKFCQIAVTASSGTAISTDMFRNFVKNSFKFDVALKHAQDEVPARKSTPEKQKSLLATNKHRRRLKRRPQRIQNTVLCQSLGDIHYYSKGNQCSRCSPEYPCGILCGN